MIERDKLLSKLKGLRQQKKLHSEVENRLAAVLRIALPELHPVPEIQGLPGGRNDLIAYDFLGQAVVFEVFASASQVSRDLLILERTSAICKIAIIVDKEIDRKVLDQYLRQIPESPYPFIFTSELFEEPPHEVCLKLREIIAGDEEAKFKRILRQKISTKDIGQRFQDYDVQFLSSKDLQDGNITYKAVFVTLVIKKCIELGVRKQHLIKLGQWLSKTEVIEFLFMRLSLGFNVLLYSDLDESIGFYSDIEMADWIRAADSFESASVILSMNATIRELEEKYAKRLDYKFSRPPGENSVTLGMSQIHRSNDGHVAMFSIPRNTKKIFIFPPMSPALSTEEYLEMVEIAVTPAIQDKAEHNNGEDSDGHRQGESLNTE